MATKKRKPAVRKKAPKRRAAPRPAARHTPESFRARHLSGSITVNDLPRSLAWYRDILGFTPGQRWEDGGVLRGIELKAGSTSFWLTQDDFAKGRDRAKGVGVRFWFYTAQDVDALAAAITARGGALDHPPSDEMGDRAFSLTDPDGFKLSIVRTGG